MGDLILSSSALKILKEKYLRRKSDGTLETPEELFKRVSKAVAEAEIYYGKTASETKEIAEIFYNLMADLVFLPNSPTLINAGKENGQLSACFVLDFDDSIDAFGDTLKNAILIQRSGGGVGFPLSKIRQKGAMISTGGVASGPVSFLEAFNTTAEVVKDGGIRRGAMLSVLRVDHPDILDFIDAKRNGGLQNFNFSVGITGEFMEVLAENQEYNLIAPHTSEVVTALKAEEVFRRICENAWATGEPGVLFLDRVKESPANPTPEINKVECANPCGEAPLYPNEPCILGSIDVSKFFTPDGRLDLESLQDVVWNAVRFLDDVIEINSYPLPAIEKMAKANRRIGLGIMGWADLLFRLRIPYDSEEAVKLAGDLMKFINSQAHAASRKLAEERGIFPNWENSIYFPNEPIRNATLTSISPTGARSIIAGCSAGIEPIFGLCFSHNSGNQKLEIVNPHFEKVARESGIWEQVEDEVYKTGRIGHLTSVPEDIRRVFVTAHEIAPEWHVRMQAAFQRYTDNAVSKTVNLPNDATIDDVAKVYILAYQLGCLGVTVFRDGCRDDQVLRSGLKEPEEKSLSVIHPRPMKLDGSTYRIKTPLGTSFVTINANENGPFEVFIQIGKSGTDITAIAESIGRLISLYLRIPSALSPEKRIQHVIEQLSGIGGRNQLGFGPNRVRSLPDAIAKVLQEHIGIDTEEERKGSCDLCPKCGQNSLVHEEGCNKCYECGYTDC